MKKNIHPQYYTKTIITCSCGTVIETGATKEKMATELCSNCHPFYTGQQKLVDTAKRVDKYEERRRKAEQIKVKLQELKVQKKELEKKQSAQKTSPKVKKTKKTSPKAKKTPSKKKK